MPGLTDGPVAAISLHRHAADDRGIESNDYCQLLCRRYPVTI